MGFQAMLHRLFLFSMHTLAHEAESNPKRCVELVGDLAQDQSICGD
jgi:hypothetical protein